jgi:predicted CopG family antitoxin
MTSTIAVSEGTRKKLMQLKIEENAKSMDELIQKMITDHKVAKLTQVAKKFRERMDQFHLTPADLVE